MEHLIRKMKKCYLISAKLVIISLIFWLVEKLTFCFLYGWQIKSHNIIETICDIIFQIILYTGTGFWVASVNILIKLIISMYEE